MADKGISFKELMNREAVAEAYQRLLAESGGSPMGAMVQSDVNRGAVPGQTSSWAQGLTPAELAQIDRYAWGAQIASEHPVVGPLALAAPIAYEGVKAVAPGIMSTIGKVLPFGEQMKPDETTSPASLENVRALIAGYRR